MLTARIPGPRSIPGRRSCLAGPPGPEIGPISVPFFHPNVHPKDHQEGEGQGSSPLSITSTGKQGGGEGRREEENMCGERSRLLGHPGRQFPQDFALLFPWLGAGPVKLGGEGRAETNAFPRTKSLTILSLLNRLSSENSFDFKHFDLYFAKIRYRRQGPESSFKSEG